MEKLVVTNNPTGERYPEHPRIPRQPDEIAESVYESYKAGASVVHVHGPTKVRDDGRVIADPEIWEQISKRIRERCDIIIEFGMALPLEQRRELLDLGPEMTAIVLTMNDLHIADRDLYAVHTRQELEAFAGLCNDKGIKPAFEVFHLGAVWNLNYLIEKGLVSRPYVATVFFGWPGGNWSPATANELVHRLDNLPPDVLPSVSVVGPAQTQLLTMAIALGANLRVGFEDNAYYAEGVLAESNAQLVARIARISRELGRELATPDEARQILGIPKR